VTRSPFNTMLWILDRVGKAEKTKYLNNRHMIADTNSSNLAMKGTQMEVTVINQTENELEVQIEDANETLLGPLLNRTLADPQVDYASYYMGHILLDEPRFYVRTKKGTPKAAINRAMESIITDIHTIQDKILKSPVGPGRDGGKSPSEPSTPGRKPNLVHQEQLIPNDLDSELEKFIAGFEKIRDMGFVKSHRTHNTGIGKTLEDLMGIEENNIDGPDFGNIEIKSQRAFSGSKVTLFTKSPEPSGVNSIMREKYGIQKYEDRPEIKELHASIFTKFNRVYGKWGFRMNPDDVQRKIYLEIKELETDKLEDVDIWYDYETIEKIIETKLQFLAYVEADTRKTDEGEEFHYKACTIFLNSSFDKFMDLLKNNQIQYDIRIGSYKTPGRKNYGKLHDHGSGFRINKDNMSKIFETHSII